MEENIKEVFVIDASYLLAFLLNENNYEVNKLMEKYQAKQINLISTFLFKFEVSNALKTAVLRKRINKLKAQKIIIEGYFLSLLEKIPAANIKQQLIKTIFANL